MVKINRTAAPVVRFVQVHHVDFGKEKWRTFTKKTLKDFKLNKASFIAGTYPFTGDYGVTEFKKWLVDDQGLKCCFCEKAIDGGDIEHYRPKRAWQQKRGGKQKKPGYYWLAYNWKNFLLSCNDCNKANRKGNLFPLLKDGKRCMQPRGSLKKELPVIINPCSENPIKDLTYHLSKPVGLTKRGKRNIRIFDLEKRADLKSGREDRLNSYRYHLGISKSTPSATITAAQINNSLAELARMRDPKSPYAGMIIASVKKGLL